MNGHGAKYERKREEAIAALLTKRNVEEAASSVGITTQTLVRWLKIDEFQDEYRQARREAFGQTVARLQQASSAAASTMMKILVDPNTPASVRLRAADSILSHAARAIEIEDVEVRLARLEAAQPSDGYRGRS